MVRPSLPSCENPEKSKFDEKYLKMIIDSSLDGITVMNEGGLFEFGNESFFRIINWSREEIIGHDFRKIIPEDAWDYCIQQWHDVQKGIINDFETRIITKSGETKYVKVAHSLAIINGEKKVVSVTKDITENKKLEFRLKESEAKFRDIFDNANDAIFTCSAQGYIITANNATVIMSGCNTIDEVIGTNFSDWFPPESLQQALNNTRKYFSGEPVKQPVIYEFIRKNGEHRWAEIRSRVIKEGDKAIALHCIARDITERIKLEQELKESEAKFRDIFENANDGIFSQDTEGYITSANKAIHDILSMTEDEVVGSHFSRWLTPESLKICQQTLKKAISGEQVIEPLITEIITKNKEHKWIEIRAWVIKDRNRITGINGIARDITEKLRLQEKLKESEALYKDLFENADDPMYTHDMKGNFRTINKIGLKLLGGTEEEIIGSNVSKWLTPEGIKLFEDRVRKISQNLPLEQPVKIEVVNNKGEHIWGEARTRLLRDGNKATGVHGIVRDITEKMKLESELRESEAKYRDLFENAQDAMYVLSAEGIVLKMNQVGLQTLGCTKDEVIGFSIYRWLTPEGTKIAQERLRKRLSREKVNPSEILEIVCKNGEHRWAEIKTRAIKEGDRITEIHGIARDITENILLKQELNRSNKQQKLLCYLIKGTRGGNTRASILKHLSDRSYNAHQLSRELKMDYKTIRHHLDVLIKNGIITKGSDGHTDIYYISNKTELNLNEIKKSLSDELK